MLFFSFSLFCPFTFLLFYCLGTISFVINTINLSLTILNSFSSYNLSYLNFDMPLTLTIVFPFPFLRPNLFVFSPLLSSPLFLFYLLSSSISLSTSLLTPPLLISPLSYITNPSLLPFPSHLQDSWRSLLERYLTVRDSLGAVFHLIDSRHQVTPTDEMVLHCFYRSSFPPFLSVT